MAANKWVGYVLGAIQIIAGLYTGNYFLVATGVITIAGTALAPTPGRVKKLDHSPNYGFDRFNPDGADASVPIVYGSPLVLLPVAQTWVSTVAERGAVGIDAVRRQAVSWIGVVEGPIAGITDVEINDVPVLSGLVTDVVIGKANGSTKVFKIPYRWVYMDPDSDLGVAVKVAGVAVTQQPKTYDVVHEMPPIAYSAAGAALPTKIDVTLRERERILAKAIRLYLSGPGMSAYEQERRAGPYPWSAHLRSRRKLRITFEKRPPANTSVRIVFDYVGDAGVTVVQDAKGGTEVVFGTAPTGGGNVTADFRTTPFPGFRMETRLGTLDQEPYEGVSGTMQSYPPSAAAATGTILAKGVPVRHSTGTRVVDDLRVIVLAPRGMIWLSDTGEGSNSTNARVGVQYRRVGTTVWQDLAGPEGTSFRLSGNTLAERRWEISIWQELRDRVDEGVPGALALLEAFERAAYEVQVTRLDKPASNSPLVQDEVHFMVVTEVLWERFVWPGTASLRIRAFPSENLREGRVKVRARIHRGTLYDPRTSSNRRERDLGSSQNPALLMLDLLTSARGAHAERYGGGRFFNEGDVFVGTEAYDASGWRLVGEPGSLIALADWCDGYVHRPSDDPSSPPFVGDPVLPSKDLVNGERRCRLNLVLDTPQSLVATIHDLATLAYCFFAMQGAYMRFPLDRDGDPVFTFYDESSPSNQNADELVVGLEAWSKTPTHVRVEFWNEALRYERDEIVIAREDLREGASTNIISVAAPGVSRETEANRLARHLVEAANASAVPVVWKAHPGVQHILGGEIVEIVTRLPFSVGEEAVAMKVRVLTGEVGMDQEGRVVASYTGRLMAAKPYSLQPATASGDAGGSAARGTPDSGTPVTQAGGTGGGFSFGTATGGVRITGATAQIVTR